MTDLISRADAIEAVKETKPIVRSTERNWGKMIAEQHSKELVKALKALPSADAVQGWIPIMMMNVKNGRRKMNDLINRQEVIKRIQGTGYAEQIKDNVIFILRMMPSEAEQHWVSCTDRMPDEKDRPMDCMVTRYSELIGAYVDMAVCERDGTWTHEDWDAIVLGDVESGRKTGLMNTHDHPILAWMPMPEPYKGGDEE